MLSDVFWETNSIFNIAYSFEPRREVFLYAVEKCDDWAWLAAEAGRFAYRIGTGSNALEGECEPGDWVLCPPGEPLARRIIEPCAFHFARFKCNGQGLHPLRGKGTLRDAERLRASFAALKATRVQPPQPEWTGHLLLDLFRHAYRELQLEVPVSMPDAVMQTARTWLEMHWNEKVSLEALATDLHLSPSMFSRRFRAATGLTPWEFLQEKRFDQARRLLLETDLTVEAVAANSGFTSGFYFSRLWAQRYGLAPGRFRRAHRV